MKQQIFTVFDQKAEAYLPPFFLPAVGMAKRTFADCVRDKDHQFGMHPEDYTLIHLGEFEDSTGEITMLNPPKILGTGIEFNKITDPLEVMQKIEGEAKDGQEELQ